MQKLICKIFGHRFRYNFATMPSKCICKRCCVKYQLYQASHVAFGELWKEWLYVDKFDNEKRTDKELIDKWA